MNARTQHTLRSLLWPLLALVIILAIDVAMIDGFANVSVIDGRLVGRPVDIVANGSRVMLLAAGMTLVIATGGVDLSVGATMAIVASIAIQCDVSGLPTYASISLAMLASLLCGAWNGTLVTVFKIQPIIATLVLMVAGRGIAQLITAGQIPTTVNPVLTFIGQGYYWFVPFSLYLIVSTYALTWLATRRTGVGLLIEATGDNASAAHHAGVPVGMVKLFTYVVAGACAGIAGLVDAGLIRAADANNAGLNMELDAIFAVVVGGTALSGGRFSLVGSFVGAVLLQTLVTTILAFQVPSHQIPLYKATAIIAVVLLQSSKFREAAVSLLPRAKAGTT